RRGKVGRIAITSPITLPVERVRLATEGAKAHCIGRLDRSSGGGSQLNCPHCLFTKGDGKVRYQVESCLCVDQNFPTSAVSARRGRTFAYGLMWSFMARKSRSGAR